jgi:hypothetical protein
MPTRLHDGHEAARGQPALCRAHHAQRRGHDRRPLHAHGVGSAVPGGRRAPLEAPARAGHPDGVFGARRARRGRRLWRICPILTRRPHETGTEKRFSEGRNWLPWDGFGHARGRGFNAAAQFGCEFEREKGFEPSTSTLATGSDRVSRRYEDTKTSIKVAIGVTQAIRSLRRSGTFGGTQGR